MLFKVNYKLFFHTFNIEIEGSVKVPQGISYFNGERNCIVNNDYYAVDYVKVSHKQGLIKKLFKIPQEIYDSEHGEVGATSIKILGCCIY